MMSKKIFIKPRHSFSQPAPTDIPQDIEAQLDAWITQSPTEEEATEKKLELPRTSINKQVRLNFNIDTKLHAKLKIYCFENKTTIKELCVSLLMKKITNL